MIADKGVSLCLQSDRIFGQVHTLESTTTREDIAEFVLGNFVGDVGDTNGGRLVHGHRGGSTALATTLTGRYVFAGSVGATLLVLAGAILLEQTKVVVATQQSGRFETILHRDVLQRGVAGLIRVETSVQEFQGNGCDVRVGARLFGLERQNDLGRLCNHRNTRLGSSGLSTAFTETFQCSSTFDILVHTLDLLDRTNGLNRLGDGSIETLLKSNNLFDTILIPVRFVRGCIQGLFFGIGRITPTHTGFLSKSCHGRPKSCGLLFG
mmetsp:Transcript_50260/g.126161  ORF Transcript_50260/g.126161 Transcript_50260/m.126161 type:complete len:266 (-) Transcript_50260:44-841(-)